MVHSPKILGIRKWIRRKRDKYNLQHLQNSYPDDEIKLRRSQPDFSKGQRRFAEERKKQGEEEIADYYEEQVEAKEEISFKNQARRK